jgi:putative Holliday junction resolvase
MRADLAELCRIARENDVRAFVVGHPVNMSGEAGPQAHLVEAFATKLQARSKLPVTLWDERLTTVEADEILRARGASLEKRKELIDQVSAVLILQSYLDARGESTEWPANEED